MHKKIGRLTKEIFIERALKIHGNKYDYSKSIITKSNIKIEIVCLKHGIFHQTPIAHTGKLKQGCVKCHNEETSIRCRKTKDQFIIESNIIHNNFYDYSKFNYTHAHNKSIIICPLHGEFLQSPNCHLKKHKCYICSKEQSNKWGWSKEKWLEIAEKKYPKLYIVNFYNDQESFIKVGITTKKRVNDRLHQIPYNIRIIKIIENDGETIWNLENKIKKQFRMESNYIPKVPFKGMYECYNINIKEKILTYVS